MRKITISGKPSPPEMPDKTIFTAMPFSICKRRASRRKEDPIFLVEADGIVVIHVS
jgi:hypothetical protein